jgi:transposase InsO family protein
MIAFIEDQRVVYGVESICRVLPIAPSTYYHRLACQADPSKASARHQRDTELRPEIKRVWDENYQVYGVRKAWHQLKREGFDLARCTVERLMKQIGIRGAVRGKMIKTTIPDTSAPCPRDKVNRVFRASAPNLLWVSDFTYVSTWQGFIYVAARPLFLNQWRTRSRSSTRSLIASSDGGSRGLPRQTLCSMPWSRPCMIGGLFRKGD